MVKKIRQLTIFITVLVLAFAVTAGPAIAAYSKVVTFGADLDRAQKAALATEFGVNLAEANVPVVEVTNAEERKYLQGLVPDSVIGNRAISSALVEILPAGRGLSVETRNINWVTTDMYSNALATAKVKDARILVAAPFPVSGTAALTGIFKAFEQATGKSLGDRPKQVANEELVRTGNLAKEIGKDKATKLIYLVKERVITQRVRDPQQIRQIVITVAAELNITLTEKQIDEVTSLMVKVSSLNLSRKDLTDQLSKLRGEVEKAIGSEPQLRSWLQRLLDAIDRLVQQIRTAVLGE